MDKYLPSMSFRTFLKQYILFHIFRKSNIHNGIFRHCHRSTVSMSTYLVLSLFYVKQANMFCYNLYIAFLVEFYINMYELSNPTMYNNMVSQFLWVLDKWRTYWTYLSSMLRENVQHSPTCLDFNVRELARNFSQWYNVFPFLLLYARSHTNTDWKKFHAFLVLTFVVNVHSYTGWYPELIFRNSTLLPQIVRTQ